MNRLPTSYIFTDSNNNRIPEKRLKRMGFRSNIGSWSIPIGWTMKEDKIFDIKRHLRGCVYPQDNSVVLYCRLRFISKTVGKNREIWAHDTKTGKEYYIFTCAHPVCVVNDGAEDGDFILPNAEYLCFRNKLKQRFVLRNGWDSPVSWRKNPIKYYK